MHIERGDSKAYRAALRPIAALRTQAWEDFTTMKRKDQVAIVTGAGRKFGEKLATIGAL